MKPHPPLTSFDSIARKQERAGTRGLSLTAVVCLHPTSRQKRTKLVFRLACKRPVRFRLGWVGGGQRGCSSCSYRSLLHGILGVLLCHRCLLAGKLRTPALHYCHSIVTFLTHEARCRVIADIRRLLFQSLRRSSLHYLKRFCHFGFLDDGGMKNY